MYTGLVVFKCFYEAMGAGRLILLFKLIIIYMCCNLFVQIYIKQ